MQDRILETRKGRGSWEIDKYLLDKVTPDQVQRLLSGRTKKFEEYKSRFLGFQNNMNFDYTGELVPYLSLLMNDVGDPFENGSYHLNNKELEYAVVRYYAKLWNFKMRDISIDKQQNLAKRKPQCGDAYWGYVLGGGSSEGNMMSFWMARDYIEGRFLIINQQKGLVKHISERVEQHHTGVHPASLPPVFFTSTATHYSVFKAASATNVLSFAEYGNQHYLSEEIPNIKRKGQPFDWNNVPTYSDLDGRINVGILQKLVEFFARKGHGIIINLNYGTTFTGAFDQIHKIVPKLRAIFEKYGLDKILMQVKDPHNPKKKYGVSERQGYWIHVDGALGAGYLPYLRKYYENECNKKNGFSQDPDPVVDRILIENGSTIEYRLSDLPPLDFTKYPQLTSCVISGHKYVGSPWPSGVFMTRHKYQLYPCSPAEYIGSTDSTLSGSRNGLSPIVFWSYLAHNKMEDLGRQAYECLLVARRMENSMREIVSKKNVKDKLLIKRAPFSLSLVFSNVNESIFDKYGLASQRIGSKVYNHLYVMPSVVRNHKTVEDFLKELKCDKAFDPDRLWAMKNMGHGHW